MNTRRKTTRKPSRKPVSARLLRESLHNFVNETSIRLNLLADGLGMTQSQIGEGMGVEASNVSSILGGKRNLTARTLVTVAAAMGHRPVITFEPLQTSDATSRTAGR